MGITINHFTHTFRRAAAPNEEEAQALYGVLEQGDEVDVWGVYPVTRGAINWMGSHPRSMYGEPEEKTSCLSNEATGYLVVYVSQDRGFAFWGEEGRKEYERDCREAARRSYRDFCALIGRLIQADEILARHCR